MRKIIAIAVAISFLGVSSLAFAKPKGRGVKSATHTHKSQRSYILSQEARRIALANLKRR